MVVATLLITAILAVLFGELPAMMNTYTIYIQFDEAPRVIEDTPARKSGIRIGSVSDVQLNDDRTVTVTLEIEEDRQIYHDEVCTINASLLGDTSLDFVRSSDPNASSTRVEPGETINGIIAADPIKIISDLQGNFAEAIHSVTKTSTEMSSILEKVGKMIDQNQQNIHDVIIRADKALLSIQKMAENANELVADPETRRQMREAIAEMPQLIRDTHNAVGQFSRAVVLVEKNLTNIQGFTEAMSESKMLARLDRGTENLDLLMGQLAQFSKSLNNPDGTLGRLVSDPELYNSLNRSARNIDELILKFGPIVHDIRVFTDKIARHPEMLGVRGAVRPSVGLK